MFDKARLKLTLWYLLIIMLISISFSAAIFRVLTSEFNRVIKMEKLRQQGIAYPPQKTIIFFQNGDDLPHGVFISPTHAEVIDEAKQRLLHTLIGINLLILGLSGAAGYFLAGRTLRPIKEMIDSQKEFITDASHELRTPLTALKSEIEVNLRDRNLNLKEAKKLLQSNLEEVNNLQALSDNLIKLTQYNKISAGVLRDDVTFNDLVKEAIKKINGLLKKKKISLKVEGEEVKVRGDKQSLTELLVILIDNAIKYSPAETTINLIAKKTSRNITIEVKDHGEGIDKEDLPHIFDRFYRADKSRTRTDVSGYGLGLSIAKEIVSKHKGIIKVTSQKNKGTTFIVHLPLNP